MTVLLLHPPAEVWRFREKAGADMFFNINYRDDLRSAEKHISEGGLLSGDVCDYMGRLHTSCRTSRKQNNSTKKVLQN
jgi:hypothetical protein